MRVSVEALGPSREPHVRANHEQILVMQLRPGSIEIGWRRSELSRFTYDSGEMFLPRRMWKRGLEPISLHLSVAVSDAALRAACDGIASQVELGGALKLVDGRVSALVAAVNEERIARFPSGRLFLDSVEQALPLALVNGHEVPGPFCAGLGPHVCEGLRVGACGDRGRTESR